MLRARDEMMLQMTEEQSPVSISNIDILKWLRVKATANLKHGTVQDIQASAPKGTVPAFDWDDCTELAQSVRLATDMPSLLWYPFGDALFTSMADKAKYHVIEALIFT